MKYAADVRMLLFTLKNRLHRRLYIPDIKGIIVYDRSDAYNLKVLKCHNIWHFY